MIDLHCHILAGLDDGAANDAETLKMAEELLAEGVYTVVATPHCNGIYSSDVAAIAYEVEHCRELFESHGLPLQLLPGGEIAMGGETLSLWRRGHLPGIGGGQALLFELPSLFLAEGARRLIEECVAMGTLVIIAHPERNPTLLRNPKLAETLRYAGVRFQITAGSLDGQFGPAARDFAESLLRRRMVEYVASDLHPRRKASLKKAAKRIKKLCGEEMANTLLRENPRALLAGMPAGEGQRLAC
jgi:protein-tyrosine phosphatase